MQITLPSKSTHILPHRRRARRGLPGRERRRALRRRRGERRRRYPRRRDGRPEVRVHHVERVAPLLREDGVAPRSPKAVAVARAVGGEGADLPGVIARLAAELVVGRVVVGQGGGERGHLRGGVRQVVDVALLFRVADLPVPTFRSLGAVGGYGAGGIGPRFAAESKVRWLFAFIAQTAMCEQKQSRKILINTSSANLHSGEDMFR